MDVCFIARASDIAAVGSNIGRKAGRQAGRRHYLRRVRVREGECPPHEITMATPVRPATASCPACFHVLLAWRLLTSQTSLSTITQKSSLSCRLPFFFTLSSSVLKIRLFWSRAILTHVPVRQNDRFQRNAVNHRPRDTQGPYLDPSQKGLQPSSRDSFFRKGVSVNVYEYMSDICKYIRLMIETLQ